MRKVIYREGVMSYPYNGEAVVLKEKGEALFHQWGLGSYRNGGNFSTAIIELEDGTVKNIPAEHVKFISGEMGDKVLTPIAGTKLKNSDIKIGREL